MICKYITFNHKLYIFHKLHLNGRLQVIVQLRLAEYIVSPARPIPLQARGRVWGNACIEFVQAAIFLVNDVLKYHMIIINNYFIISRFHVNSRAILFYYFNIFPLHVIVIVRNQSLAI